jgi:hypothetical protein
MPLSKQADNVAGAIDNDREQTSNVTAQNVHVEHFQVGNSGIAAPKYNLTGLFASETNLRLNNDRVNYASQATDTILGHKGLETKHCQSCRAEHSTIRTGINEEFNPLPGTVTG